MQHVSIVIVCNSDVIAHGVLRALRHLGRKVPGEVAIVGFGENSFNTWVESLAGAGYHCVNIGKMHTIPYNAVVLFTSDHGVCLGQHGLVQKWAMYDCITRVPLIAWSPQRFGASRRVDGLCQLFGLGPTILELAEVPVP